MKAGLLCFIFDVYLPRPLMVEQHLAQHQFEVIFMHIIARACYFLITHIREVKSGTVTMTALRGGIDIPAVLQVFDVLLGAQYRGDVEAVMR